MGEKGGKTVIEIQYMKEEYIVYTTLNKRKLINAELENAIWIELRIKKEVNKTCLFQSIYA